MDSPSALVVKVSYGGVLRRFRVPFNANGQLDLDMAGLKEKIFALFNLPVDTKHSLTYSDEDGDVVALVDDNDLFDVTNQRLKFLKINVQSNNGLPVASESSGSSIPSQNPVSKIQKGLNDVLMAVPNPMRDTISKACMDLASKAACSSPVVGEMLDCISKLGQLSKPQESSPLSPVFKAFSGEVRNPGSSGRSLSREVPFTGEKNDVSEWYQIGEKPATLNEPTDSAGSKASGHVQTSSGLGASFNECPFRGITGKYSSPSPVNPNKYVRRTCPFKKSSNGDNSTSLDECHFGIQCDGCGVLPICGTRFKSMVKEDYDLCNICFLVMGNDGDYIKMDVARGFHSSKGPARRGLFIPRRPYESLHFRCTQPKLDSRFVRDVNVVDGTVVAPSAPFTKIWRMRNNGSMVWPRGSHIVWVDGDIFSNSFSVDLQIPVEGVPINGELDVKVDFVAPESPGRYISHWRMASSNGVKFGQSVWVLINVDASLKGSVENQFHGLNLNASPDENCSRGFTGINRNSIVDPGMVKGADLEREASGTKIPVKDNLPVGEGHPAIPNTHPASASSWYNIIDLPKMPNTEAVCGGSSSTKDILVTLQEEIEKNDVELTMLKELEEMGFKEMDLNKKILRENEYNLEQSIDALCGVNQWDPILKELQEMGFCDNVTNKRLLKKNKGSIKDVVLDLLTEENENAA